MECPDIRNGDRNGQAYNVDDQPTLYPGCSFLSTNETAKPEEGVESSNEEYIQLGVPEVWIEPLKNWGTPTSPNFVRPKNSVNWNDLNGFNKKQTGLAGIKS